MIASRGSGKWGAPLKLRLVGFYTMWAFVYRCVLRRRLPSGTVCRHGRFYYINPALSGLAVTLEPVNWVKWFVQFSRSRLALSERPYHKSFHYARRDDKH